MVLSVNVLVSAYAVQEKRMEILANNLANVSTFGFKGDRPVFQVADAGGALQSGTRVSTAATPRGMLPLSYLSRLQENVLVFSGVNTDFSQGDLRRTGNTLDLALKGSGLFVVSTPRGARYTRNGSFTLDEKGVLVTQEGFPVLGESGPIRLEGEQVRVTTDGAVFEGQTEVDSLMIVDASSPEALKKVGENLFEAPGGPLTRKDPAEVEVLQGFLESSNVNIVKEMVTLIEVSKAYESYQKVIHSLNEALSKSINEIGRLS